MRLILKLIKRIAKGIASLILIVIISIIALGSYVTFIERNLLVDKNYEITINEEGKQNLRVVQFTDTQLGEYYTLYNLEKVVNKINDLDADIVVFTGDLIDEYSDYPIDLALSRHSHGGQVYIPFYGPVKKNILSEKYNRGLFEFENYKKTKLYVNTGLGNTKVPFRFLTIPEIAVFDIKL